MLNEKDLVTKYRETIYQETGTWVMPLTVINENPSDRAMQLVLSTNRRSLRSHYVRRSYGYPCFAS